MSTLARDRGAVSPAERPSSGRLDIMLIDPDAQRALVTARELERIAAIRCAQKGSGREALAGYSRARFDAIVCQLDLGDTDCWRWIRMVRSGRFGYGATPVLVLCQENELSEFAPLADQDTSLILEGHPPALAEELRAIHAGTRRIAVLVVEDEDLAAQSAARALEKFYHVDIARDGAEGVRLWQAHRHALVVLDLMLPDVPGARVLAALLNENPQQPVIVVTAHDAIETHQELMLAGAAEFVSKPLDLHTLPQLCARTLQRQACLSNALRSTVRESNWADLAMRVRVAYYQLERGRHAPAGAHLRRALLDARTIEPSDDQWALLLGEFESE